MLNSLSIKNFALIEDIELSLEGDLSIITGETGAGKSILLGALALLLGKRADLSSIKNPDSKCVIEGIFSISAYNLQPLFNANDLDYEPETIIRREILPSGKSRAFVNDTPVKLKQLTALGSHLVDIHSQHETLFVSNSHYQYEIIDALADNANLLEQYKKAYAHYRSLQQELTALKERQQEAQKTYDYHLFLHNELQESNVTPGIQEELEERQQQLAHVEELKEKLSLSLQQLQQEEVGAIEHLQQVKNRLVSLEGFGETYQTLSTRIQSALIELEDITAELTNLAEHTEDDPEVLEEVNERLQNLYALQKKHGVSTVKELMTIQKQLADEVAISKNADQEQAALTQKIATAQKEALQIAQELSNKREKAIPKFTITLEGLLQKLGMPNAQINITLDKNTAFNSHGNDHLQWLFSANKGGRFQEMKKSASGGELSRITLGIKSILATYHQLPTLIFDEIDTGVSGEVAQKMGDIMKVMGKHLQVISITHLPQIAAKGKQHFKVYKETQGENTQTIISKLNNKERIQELAEMLGGKEKSSSAIAHAKALLQ